MLKVLKKMNDAIELIKNSNLTKRGRNTFSGYSYYTPEQVSELVIGACHKVKIFPKFDLIKGEHGIDGKLKIFDLESDEVLEYTMASAIPEIKATNVSQQLGGAMTYTKRYLYMNAFDIVDNNLDFDTTENTQKMVEEKAELLAQIRENLELCKSREDIMKIWKDNIELQSDKEFKNLINEYNKNLKK